ncbi:putative DSBA family oxidoreductase [Mycena rosella]|uniref:Glutathione S-transferase kappa 1 n=1 Tax=Mycena rosella TaxID=1033263 RepID=A0AAD7GHN5_MYCRO|nr:putative DSBA family oxidoreductase [Mycena rosella]
MGAKIDCYLDCTSFYGYLAFKHLLAHRTILQDHGVEVEFYPVFLGGINVGSGNKPPWSLPAKAAYGNFDSARAKKYFDATEIQTPSFFPILSILPQRAMIYIKDHYPRDKFERVFFDLFPALWVPPQSDLSKPENLKTFLLKSFTASEVDAILAGAGTPEYKAKLTDVTKMVVEEQGAFGCPWFWVTNAQGTSEPFFGSDRFHFMWEFLGLPWQNIRLLPVDGVSDSKARQKANL